MKITYAAMVVGVTTLFSFSAFCAEIHQAVEAKNISKVKQIIEADQSSVNSLTAGGATPLHIAAGINNVELIGLLVKNGARLNSETKEGFTPMHWAACMNNLAAVNKLISLGADITIKSKSGKTALQIAQQEQASEAIALLQSIDSSMNAKKESAAVPNQKASTPQKREVTPASVPTAVKAKSADETADKGVIASVYNAVVDPMKQMVGMGADKRPVNLTEDIRKAEEALKGGDYDTAYNLMSAALREYPDDPKVNFIYGMASYNQKDYARAIMAFEAVLKKDPGNDSARYGIAQAYFMTRQYEMARRTFSQVMTRNPPEIIKKNIEEYMQNIEKGIDRFSMSGRADVSVFYDSNVNVGPNSSVIDITPILYGTTVYNTLVLGEESQPTDSYGYSGMFTLSGMYDVQDVGGWAAIGDVMVFNNTIPDADSNEILFYQASTGLRNSWGNYNMSLPLRYSHIDLASDPLTDMYGFAPSFTVISSSGGRKDFTTGFLAEQRNYDKLIDRDNTRLELSESVVSFYGERNNPLTTSLSVYRELARADVYSCVGARLMLGYQYITAWGGAVYGGIGYSMVNYDEQQALALEKRADKQLQYSLGVNKVIKGGFTLDCNVQITDNSSTFGLYDYSREVYTVSTFYAF